MKQTRLIMGMPITVEIVDEKTPATLAAVFDYFTYIDEKFSTYKPESEISKINRGELRDDEQSDDMKIIFMLAEETKQRTDGFFDIRRPGHAFYDPSGIVKGWAIWNAAKLIESRGFTNFYVDAGGDIQTSGMNGEGAPWSIGIRNPLAAGTPRQNEIVKTIYSPAVGIGIATSGTYIRGDHIYNPHDAIDGAANDIISLTVIGPNVYEADRFATAAFAMGRAGIHFIEKLSVDGSAKFEGYIIDKNGIATMTSGFARYTHLN
jgi:FAD:protein FMN transferase